MSVNLIPIKFKILPTSSGIDSFDYFVGIKDVGAGVFVNYKYNAQQIIDYINSVSSLEHTVSTSEISTTTNANDTLTLSWFSGKSVREVLTNSQSYIRNSEFSQSTDKLIMTLGNWYDGQKILVKL